MSTATQPDALHDLLGEVLDELCRISDYVAPKADASEVDGPNREMSIYVALEGSPHHAGLVDRVRAAWQTSR